MMYVFSGLKPRAIRSRAFSSPYFVVCLSFASSSTTNFSSSVIWK